jgi:hypothetical protein
MIAAAIQCDVDGISKGSHHESVALIEGEVGGARPSSDATSVRIPIDVTSVLTAAASQVLTLTDNRTTAM